MNVYFYRIVFEEPLSIIFKKSEDQVTWNYYNICGNSFLELWSIDFISENYDFTLPNQLVSKKILI